MRRRVLPYAFLALAATAAAGGLAINRLLDRPGETALAFIPENALGVAAVDFVPAPDQVLAFKHIDELVSEANGGKSSDPGSYLSKALPDESFKPLADQIDRSFAMAWLPSPTASKTGDQKIEDGHGVVIVALKDPAAFEKALRAKGKLEKVGGTTVYWLSSAKMGEGKAAVMIHDRYAIASDKTWPLAAVEKVIRGEAKSITANPAFATARAKALSSSNLLVLVSPEMAKGEDWLVGSMAIRDGGMEFAVSGQTNDPEVMKAGSLTPIGPELLSSLPRGAYGFIAAAQPGPAVALAGDKLDEPAKEMKDEMELDLKADILPALGGNVAVGFYPSFGPDAGIDLLVSIDDANGANPASLARKLEKILDGKMEEGGSPQEWKIEGRSADGTAVRRLADEPVDSMREALTGVEKSFFRPLTLSRGKTVTWAMVGNAVVLATSQNLLDRAIASRKSPSTATGLSGDAALGAKPSEAADGQFAFAISMKRLVEGIRNTIDPSHMSPDAAKTYRKALSLYDATTEPLAIRANMGSDGRYRGYVSIPFDWSKLPGMMK